MEVMILKNTKSRAYSPLGLGAVLLMYLLGGFYLQAQEHCPHYDRLMQEAETFVQDSVYLDALNKYNSALTHCPQKQEEVKAKIDTLFVLIDGLRKEAEVKEAEALKMQAKMQRAVFDKAVQDKFPEWQGYEANFEKKGEILRQIDSLDLSGNALISLPREELLACPNLQHLNLLGNEKMVWDSLVMINDLPKLQSIYVSVNDLSDIDSSYWKRITGIEILLNRLEAIPKNILAQKQLTYLDLSGEYDEENQFNILPDALFELRELTYLDLSECNIESLPHTLPNLSNLQYLNCHSNQLAQLPKEIGILTQLQELILTYNGFSALPEDIGKLTELQSLDLSYNPLRKLPNSFGNLKKLRELSCYFNGLIILPESFGNLSQLQKLNIGANTLVTLPKSFENLNQLQELILSNNLFNKLPEEITKLANLRILGLELSNLSYLPPEIRQLSQLEELMLKANRISSLPPEIGSLTNLKTLDLSGNPLSYLPSEIGNLKQLESLGLWGDPVSYLPPEIGKLTQLKGLDLRETKLYALPPEFGELRSLQYLNLDKSSLQSLPSEIGQLTKLKSLSSRFNQLSSLPPEIGKLIGLQYIWLPGNKLRNVPTEIANLKKLQYIDLWGNPIKTEEQKKIKTLLPNNCGFKFSYEGLLWEYYQQGVLKEKKEEFKDVKNLSLNYPFKIEEQREIKNLLPNCDIEFSDFDYEKLLWEYYQKGILKDKINEFKEVRSLNLSETYGYANAARYPLKIEEQREIKNLLPNCDIEFSDFDYEKLLWEYYQKGILKDKINEFKEVKKLDLSQKGIFGRRIYPFKIEEQREVKKMLPNCEITFSNTYYKMLLWAYYRQGILKEKINEFKEVKKLDLRNSEISGISAGFSSQIRTQPYVFSIEEQKEIQKLLPHCDIIFKELSANDYNRAVIEEYNKGNYQIAYEYQQKACALDSTNASNFFNLAYFALYNNDYQVTISAAQKTLALDPKQVSVETNLALGYLLNNQWEEAKEIYMKWKGKKFPDGRACNPIFLQDMADLEKAGVKHQDFEKVRELLK